MATSISVFASRQMMERYSSDDSYHAPIAFGSLADPLNGLTGETSPATAVWVKNTGTTKLHQIAILATDGAVYAHGGVPSANDDAYIELALDSNASLPNSHRPPATSYVKALSSTDSALIQVENVVSAGGTPKTLTFPGDDADARTMLPGEYAILWLRCSIDSARSPGGALPTPPGIRNIKLAVMATEAETPVTHGALSLTAMLLVQLYAFSSLEAKAYVETLVSLWEFETGSGNVAYDSKGSNHGLIAGGVWWHRGIDEGCIECPVGSVINCGNSPNLNSGPRGFTFEVWFKSPVDHLAEGTILRKLDGTCGYALSLDADGRLAVAVGDDAGHQISRVCGEYLNDTGWHHAVVVVSREAGLAKVFLDNVQEGSDIDISHLTGDIANSADFVIGDSFAGRVDDAAFYNRVLSDVEVHARYIALWDAYLALYGIIDEGELVRDNNGRVVVDEVY